MTNPSNKIGLPLKLFLISNIFVFFWIKSKFELKSKLSKIQLEANDLYELPNNLLVVEILEAAKKSAQTGKTVKL